MTKRKKKIPFKQLDHDIVRAVHDCTSPIHDAICRLVDCSAIKCENKKTADTTQVANGGFEVPNK